jgi:hypothetical protein
LNLLVVVLVKYGLKIGMLRSLLGIQIVALNLVAIVLFKCSLLKPILEHRFSSEKDSVELHIVWFLEVFISLTKFGRYHEWSAELIHSPFLLSKDV